MCAIFRSLHDRSKVDSNTLITLGSLASRRGRLVGFVKLGVEADRTVTDFGCDGQAGYPKSILAHITDTVRMHVSETLVPNDAKDLTGQVVVCQETHLAGSSRIETGVAGSTQ